MKKNIYSLFLAVITLAGFTACSDSDNDYKWADVPGNAQVYFSKDLPSQQNISIKVNSFSIPVSRVKTDDAITVGISLTSDDNFLTAPGSVSFAAGQSSADITISYNPETLVYDQFKSATLTISDENYTTPYGSSSYTFKAGVLSPYASIGSGSLVEDYLWGYSCSVNIMQNQENPNIFRVYGASAPVNGGSASAYLEITVCKPGDTFRGVTITQNDLVYFDDYNSGYHHSSYDADIMLYHPSKFTATNPEEFWLHNVVLAYQEDGTPGQIQLAPRYYMDGVGGWNASQTDGAVIITFPGYAPKDYSAEFACTGVFTDLSGAVFAEGILELGADAQDVRAVVVSADADAEAVADAIAAGELEATAVSAGNIYVPIEEGQTGKLQVVVVVLDEEGVVKGVYSSAFEYYGGGANPWQSIGIGLYTEDFIGSVFGADPVTYEVEIEENSENPGLYRMLSPYDGKYPYNEEGDWDASAVYNIEVNAVDPDGVYIEQQATGVDWGYGPISIISWGARFLGSNAFEDVKAAGYLGTLKDGIITLPVFERETDNGTAYYQGLTVMGTSSYYGCTNGAFKLVLPEAVSGEARAKARSMAKARSFEKRLNGKNKGYSIKQMRILANKMAPIEADSMIAE